MAAVVDMLQTPAFLCRQTDFIRACAATPAGEYQKGPVPGAARHAPGGWKARDAALEAGGDGNNILGFRARRFFPDTNLVSDMRSLAIMRETDCPVVFDATHPVQLPGGRAPVGRPARIRAGAGACRRRGRRGRAVSWKPIPIPLARCPTAPMPCR